MEKVSVAEAKKRLSEYISKVEVRGDRIVISRRGNPVAAMVSIDDLELLNSMKERGGLADAMGKWKGYAEIEKAVGDAVKSRSKDAGRKVSI